MKWREGGREMTRESLIREANAIALYLKEFIRSSVARSRQRN